MEAGGGPRFGSGLPEIDRLIGGILTGDNVIWEADSGVPVDLFVSAFLSACEAGGTPVIYVSFNSSPQTIATLKEALKDTEYKEKLDRKAETILNHYRKAMENGGLISVKTMVREGIPSEEIAKAAEEENVELVIVGCNGKTGLNRLITGCVSKEVERGSRVPVLVAKDVAETCGLKEAAITA